MKNIGLEIEFFIKINKLKLKRPLDNVEQNAQKYRDTFGQFWKN